MNQSPEINDVAAHTVISGDISAKTVTTVDDKRRRRNVGTRGREMNVGEIAELALLVASCRIVSGIVIEQGGGIDLDGDHARVIA